MIRVKTGDNSNQQKPINLTTNVQQSDVNVSSQKSAVSNKPTNLTPYFKKSDGNVSNQKSTVSSIFKGISIYVNGRTDPPPEKLKRLVLTHGGRYIYYPSKSNITHIIASNSSYTKIRELKNGRAVLPNWITDSVEAGRLLPDAHYLYQASKPSKMPVSGLRSNGLEPQKLNMKTPQKLQQEHGQVVARHFREVNGKGNLQRVACPRPTSTAPSLDGRSTSMNPAGGKSQSNHLYSEGDYPVGPFNHQQFNGCYFPKSTDPNFLAIFYSHSRLHHLTTWKAKHKAFVKKLQQNGDRSFPGRKELKKFISTKKVQNETELKRDKTVPDTTDRKDKAGPDERGQSSKKNDSVIMHIDMDCFFVAVSMLNYPELQGKPVAVAHYAWKSDGNGPRSEAESGATQRNTGAFRNGSPKRTITKYHPKSTCSNSGVTFQNRGCVTEHSKQRQALHSSIASERENFSSLAEIASCSYEARKAGVKNGMIMKNAKQLCPDLRTIPYDFEGYYRVSRQLYEIVARYTHDIEACSCDELLVDITTVLEDTGATPLEFAQVVREEIYEKTRCTASAGIASSAVLARLCTRVAKPNGAHLLQDGEEVQLLSSVPVRELTGVGGSISKKLQSLGIFTCADLQQLTLNELQKEFGPKTGHILYQHCRGQDDRPLSMERERKYVSVEVNYGIRFQTEDDVVEFVYRLGGELHKRLKDLGMVGRTITVKLKVRRAGTPKEDTKFMGYGVYDNRIRSQTLRQETDDIGTIQRECRNILRQLNAHPEDIRGVGVQISRLKNVSSVVGVTKSLEDMLPKKKDICKRSTSLDSFPSTSKTSANAKSYSLLNFVQPKRKLSLDEDLMKCKSKKMDAALLSKIKSDSKISAVTSSAGLVAQKQEKEIAVKKEPLSFPDVERAPMFAKGTGKMGLSWKEQSSSQLSQKFGNLLHALKAGQVLSTTGMDNAALLAKEKYKEEVSPKPQSSLPLSQKFDYVTETTKGGQPSAVVTEQTALIAKGKWKTELPSKMQSSSQFSQERSNSMKPIQVGQNASATVPEKAALFVGEKTKTKVSSKMQSSSQFSRERSDSVKSIKERQTSSATVPEKAALFAEEKSKTKVSSKMQSSSQFSQEHSNSVKPMKVGQTSSTIVPTKAAHIAKEKGKTELSSKMQSSSQFSKEHSNSMKPMKVGQNSSATAPTMAALIAKEKGKTELSSKMQSSSQFSQDHSNSVKPMKEGQTSSTIVPTKAALIAKEKGKTELSSKMQSSSQFSQERSKSVKPMKVGQTSSTIVPTKAALIAKQKGKTELSSKMQSSSQFSQERSNSVKPMKVGQTSSTIVPTKAALIAKEKGKTELSSKMQSSSQFSQERSNSVKPMKVGQTSSTIVPTKTALIAKEKGKTELSSKMQSSSQFSKERSNSMKPMKVGQNSSATAPTMAAHIAKEKGKTELSSKKQSSSQFSQNCSNSMKSKKERQDSSVSFPEKAPFFRNEKGKTELCSEIQSLSQFSQKCSNSVKSVKEGQASCVTFPEKAATFTRDKGKTELCSKMQSSQFLGKVDNSVKTMNAGQSSFSVVSDRASPVSKDGNQSELSLTKEGSSQLSQDGETSVAGVIQASPSVTKTSGCDKDSFEIYSQEQSSQEEDSDVLYSRSGKRFTQIEDPEFLTEFYRHSKYHLMSSWRIEHKLFISKLRSREDRKFPGLEKFKIFMNTKGSGANDKEGTLHNENTASQESSSTLGPSQNASFNHAESGSILSEDKSVIMHVDMDCFFVAVSLMKFPELQGAPLAVAHAGAKPMQNMWFDECDRSFLEKKKWKNRSSECVEINHKERVNSPVPKTGEGSEEGQSGASQGQSKSKKMSEWETTYYNSMAEISSCSYEARAAGVEKGMLLADAVTLCPNLLTLPYDFEKYHEVSRLLYETVASFTDDIEAVSCDEMFIDIAKILRDTGAAPMEIAHFIRDEILAKTKCTASVGIASNTLLARLCTRIAKPNGIYQLEDDKVEDFMKTWPVRDLPGIGESISKKLLAKFEIQSCAELQQLSLKALQKEFGPKTGQIIYQSCRGQAEKPIRMEKERKYVSVDVNFGIRFKNEEEVMDFIYRMADEMHKRLKDLQMAGRKLTIKLKIKRPGIVRNSQDDSRFLGTGAFDSKYRSVTLPQETDDLATIRREFKSIFLSLKVAPEDVRGVGVQLSRLKKVSSLLGVTKSLEELLPKKSDIQKTSPPTSPDKNPSTTKTLGKPKKYSLLNFVQPKRKSSSDEDLAHCKAKKFSGSTSSTDESELESSSGSQGSFCNSRDEDDLKEDTINNASLKTTKVSTQLSSGCDKRKGEGSGERKCDSKESSPSKIAIKDLGKSNFTEVKLSDMLKNLGVCQSKSEKNLDKGNSMEGSEIKIAKPVSKCEAVDRGQSNIAKYMVKSELRVGSSSKIAKNLGTDESMEGGKSGITIDVGKTESSAGSPSKVSASDMGKNALKEETSTKCTSVKNKSVIPSTKYTKTYTQVNDPGFLAQFYQNSKFHHISTWKVEHKTFINDLQKNEEKKFPGKQKLQMFTKKDEPSSPEKEESSTEHSISKTYFGSGRTIFDQVGPERIVWENKSVILHIDMDCFFVSVSLLNYPELRGLPLAVAHTGVKSSQVANIWHEDFERAYFEKKMWKNPATNCIEISCKERVHPYGTVQIEQKGENLGGTPGENGVSKPVPLDATYLNSMAEIASCSYEARKAGVENGMLLVEAKSLCPDLRTIPYHFENYHKVSWILYETVASFTNEIEAVSCDEMFVDITKILRDTGAAPMEFAQLVRDEIFARTQCTASVGIASNTLLARLCTRVAKPNGIFLLEDSKVDEFMKSVPVRSLPGIGEAISQKLLMLGVTTCGDMQQLSLTFLQRYFGTRTGHDLYQHCRGKNDQPIKTEREQKLVSSTVNYGIRFKTNDDALKFISELAEVVHKKLQKTGMKGRTIMLKLKIRRKGTPQEELKFMGHGICENKTRTISLRQETDDLAIIKRESYALYWQMGAPPRDIRGVGLHITRLKKSSSASSKSLIDMLPKKSDLVKSPSSSPPKSPTLKLNSVKSPSNFSPISTFFNKKRKEERRFFFPDDDDDDDVFRDEKYGCSPSEKKGTSSSPIHSSPDKPLFSPKPITMFGSSPTKRDREDSDTSSNSPLNSPFNLDPEVLSSLPPDILREVLEEERLKMKKTQNIVEKLGKVEDLPSFSKIDPSCLDALPKEIQGELFTAYRRKAALASMKTPEKRISSFQTQLSPTKAAKRKRSVSKERPKKVEYQKPSWQRNIFEALNISSQSLSSLKVKKASQDDVEDNIEKVLKKEI